MSSQDKHTPTVELETHSSSESASPSMGQSGELIDFGSSYDDIQLARAADEAHDRLAKEGKAASGKPRPAPLKNGNLATDELPIKIQTTYSEMSPPPSPTEIFVHTRRDTAVEVMSTPEATPPVAKGAVSIPGAGAGSSEADTAPVTASELLSASAPAASSREPEDADELGDAAKEVADAQIQIPDESRPIDTAQPTNPGNAAHCAVSEPPNLLDLDPDTDADLKAYICHHGVRSPAAEPSTPTEHTDIASSVPTISRVAVAVVSPEFDFPPTAEAVSPEERAREATIAATKSMSPGTGAPAAPADMPANGTKDAQDGKDTKVEQSPSRDQTVPTNDAIASEAPIVAPPTPVSVHELTVTELSVTEVTIEEVVSVAVLTEDPVPHTPTAPMDKTPVAAPPVPPAPSALKTKTKLRVRGIDMWWDGKPAHRAGIASVFAALSAVMYQGSIKCTSPAPIYACAWFAVAALNVLQPGPHLRTAQDWTDVLLDTTTKIVAAAVIKSLL